MGSCGITYEQWVNEFAHVELASYAAMRSSLRPLHCILEAGHEGPHKWAPIRNPKPAGWTKPYQFNKPRRR